MTAVKKTLSILVLPALLLAVACSDGLPPEFQAPDFTLKSPLNGGAFSLSDIKGKPAVIYWFTSW